MIGPILDIVNKFIPDSDKQAELAIQLRQKENELKQKQADIIKQEMNTKAGNWRPRLMYLCMTMIGVHWLLYDVVPYFVVLFDLNIYTRFDPGLSDNLWSFLELGIGGYIGARTVEKVAGIWRK